MTTFLRNTNIAGLMQVSSGNIGALQEMTKEFKQLVQEPLKKATATAAPAGQNTPRPEKPAERS